MVRLLFIVLVTAVQLSLSQGSGSGKSAKTVCEVLESVDEYRGKLIEVQGWLGINSWHGVAYLSQEEEDGQTCPGLKGNRVTWPGRILVIWPADDPADGPVAFRAEPGDIWRRLYYHVKKSEVGVTVKAIIEGELRSRPGIVIHRRNGARPLGNGYGRYGDFPAELVIKRVVKIEPPIKVY